MTQDYSESNDLMKQVLSYDMNEKFNNLKFQMHETMESIVDMQSSLKEKYKTTQELREWLYMLNEFNKNIQNKISISEHKLDQVCVDSDTLTNEVLSYYSKGKINDLKSELNKKVQSIFDVLHTLNQIDVKIKELEEELQEFVTFLKTSEHQLNIVDDLKKKCKNGFRSDSFDLKNQETIRLLKKKIVNLRFQLHLLGDRLSFLYIYKMEKLQDEDDNAFTEASKFLEAVEKI